MAPLPRNVVVVFDDIIFCISDIDFHLTQSDACAMDDCLFGRHWWWTDFPLQRCLICLWLRRVVRCSEWTSTDVVTGQGYSRRFFLFYLDFCGFRRTPILGIRIFWEFWAVAMDMEPSVEVNGWMTLERKVYGCIVVVCRVRSSTPNRDSGISSVLR